VGTFLVDGAVAGTWRHEKGEVRTTPFAPLAPAVAAEVGAEAARLAAPGRGPQPARTWAAARWPERTAPSMWPAPAPAVSVPAHTRRPPNRGSVKAGLP
jgi:hypothetical protein